MSDWWEAHSCGWTGVTCSRRAIVTCGHFATHFFIKPSGQPVSRCSRHAGCPHDWKVLDLPSFMGLLEVYMVMRT